MKIINYPDVTLDLRTATFQPYVKPGKIPQDVHRDSNHPPNIIQNIPAAINLCSISSSNAGFSENSKIHQEALNYSGYNHQLTFNDSQTAHPSKCKRHRNVSWFNPPYSMNVKTKIGRSFLSLVDSHFHDDYPLHNIFNRNTVKISYSCMSSMLGIINRNNKMIMNTNSPQAKEPAKQCNCRSPLECPLDNKVLSKSVVYQCTVRHDNTTQSYVGITAKMFKSRYNAHKSSFNNKHLEHSTSQSKYIWGLKAKTTNFRLTGVY